MANKNYTQIKAREALSMYLEGGSPKVLIPGDEWGNYRPASLEELLDGVLFFADAGDSVYRKALYHEAPKQNRRATKEISEGETDGDKTKQQIQEVIEAACENEKSPVCMVYRDGIDLGDLARVAKTAATKARIPALAVFTGIGN